MTDQQKQSLWTIVLKGKKKELFNYVHSIELEAEQEAKQELERKLNQAIIELREKLI